MWNLVAVLLVLALSACTGLQVKTEHDREADFSRDRSYTWTEGVPARDPSLESQIRVAIDREPPFKGLQKVDRASSPNLYVSTYVSVEEERVVQPDQWGYNLGPVGMGSSRVHVLTLSIGMLLVDLVDARSSKLVWRGQACKAVGRQVSEETVRKAVPEIFRGYPPRSYPPED